MGVFLDILSGVGNTLDVPGSMVRDIFGGENPFAGYQAGVLPSRGRSRKED